MSEVRSHTRTVNGKTVPVHRHARAVDDGQAAQQAAEELAARAEENGLTVEQQAKRDRFQTRVERERKPGRRKPSRAPGEKGGQKRGPKPARAKRHAKKAKRLWRKHKVKALFYGALAAGEITAWAAWRSGVRARALIRHLRSR